MFVLVIKVEVAATDEAVLLVVPLKTTYAPGETFNPLAGSPADLIVFRHDPDGTQREVDKEFLTITVHDSKNAHEVGYQFTELGKYAVLVAWDNHVDAPLMTTPYTVQVLEDPTSQRTSSLVIVPLKSTYAADEVFDPPADLDVYRNTEPGALEQVPDSSWTSVTINPEGGRRKMPTAIALPGRGTMS